ncbi:M28 family metallopeptidase [Sphingobium sp. CCH11-B1]|jgi:Zn-dependent M28 family amino/carboxypeptidase|uniref:M28 family metallopeptidase n=1 Tax=Sphingobium sp. CCH11-B1 TaxID=1768781 RepID=UPI00082E1D3D|nr:M28 family metallopeptidase [Sphingobium sp. CCH11-B1]MEA3389179.1 M28 family metallopeptidase [Pseudomonadota bacterium]
MRLFQFARPLLSLPAIALSLPVSAQQDAGARWWSHVQAIANDGMEGRGTGTPGYDRAADYVIGQLKALGLKPAGVDGYKQPVAFVEQVVQSDRSSAALIGAKGETALTVPGDIIFSGGGGPVPEQMEAPLVFAGYGLHLPEVGHDDFAGLDLKGKIVVVLSGGPSTLSGALKSHARSERAKWLADQGAVGLISLVTPKQVEIPWDRRVALASAPSLYYADAALRETHTPFLSAQLDPAKSALLFEGSGKDFAAIAAAADASAPVASFPLAQRLKASVAAARRDLSSPNLIAVMPGSDPKLKAEYVVLSAHLDGYGVGTPIRGDAIYNGALDNASGVASLLEIARALRASKGKPKRSILFAFVTAEEKGLLGSRYFARRPTVPQRNIVADLNFDMALPIFPLTSVTPVGYDQSSLGKDAAAVSEAMKLPIVPDPFPDRNVFIRSDQYAFIREGIPALFFKYGFKAGTPEAETEKAWRANIYHSPFDDLKQPVMPAESGKLNDYVTAVTLRVANNPQRPSWNADSFFRRFAK